MDQLRNRLLDFASATVVLSLCLGTGRRGFGADLSTADGLTLRLGDGSGAVEAVVVGGRKLALIQGQRGGLSYREMMPLSKHEPRELARIEFERGRATWAKMTHKDWREGGRGVVVRRDDGGAGGSRGYIRLGEKQQYGHGVAFESPVRVEPNMLCEISWAGRVPSAEATYIVYIRLFDEQGQDITEGTRPPGKWLYSPHSKTHYQGPIKATKPNTWERLARSYLVPGAARVLDVALCLWRGNYVDADSFGVAATGRGGWLSPKAVGGWLPSPSTETAGQHYTSQTDDGLSFSVQYVPKTDHIWVQAEVRDTHKPAQDRALQVYYTLPIHAPGWWWHDDIRSRRRIEGDAVYAHNTRSASHEVSLYPFSAVNDDRTGLALAAPMDWPRMERRQYSLGRGFGTSVDLGLSSRTTKLGAGRATFAFAIYRIDPEWGFRSAAERYYRVFPHLFTKRVEREGCWLFPVRPREIPQPEDFGLTFWEGFSNDPKERAYAREHGIYILSYIRPRQMSQALRGVKDRSAMPSHDEMRSLLRSWAEDKSSTLKWNRGPRHEVAQAVLNSLPEKADGRAPFHFSHYDVWAHVWLVNTDPDVPAPNCALACKRYKIDPVLPHADGIYVDNVFVAGHENYRHSHLAQADVPLSFSMETGRPVLLGAMSFYEFLAWLSDYMHKQGKLVQFNTEERAYRFYGHLADVLGQEVGSLTGGPRRLHEVETDAVCNLRRTYAYHKPLTNLLQEGDFRSPVPPLTQGQVEQYLKHQTFYGFYPGIATAGGEERPGYRGWKRYFRSPEQFERDRGLFKKYIPVIRRINRAGWEPVTYAHSSEPKIALERFGSWEAGDLHFTLRNQSPERRRGAVRVMLGKARGAAQALGRAVVTELLSGRQLSMEPAQEATAAFDVDIDGFDTWVVFIRGE